MFVVIKMKYITVIPRNLQAVKLRRNVTSVFNILNIITILCKTLFF